MTHLHTLGIARIAVVHADDSFGLDGLEGANKGFSKAGFQPVVVIKADRGKPDFKTIVPAITGKDAQAVVWIASGNAVADGVKALRATGSAAQVVTLSNNASAGFVKSLGEHGRGVIVTQVFPSERSLPTASSRRRRCSPRKRSWSSAPRCWRAMPPPRCWWKACAGPVRIPPAPSCWPAWSPSRSSTSAGWR